VEVDPGSGSMISLGTLSSLFVSDLVVLEKKISRRRKNDGE
jgi:hypothetical protein